MKEQAVNTEVEVAEEEEAEEEEEEAKEEEEVAEAAEEEVAEEVITQSMKEEKKELLPTMISKKIKEDTCKIDRTTDGKVKKLMEDNMINKTLQDSEAREELETKKDTEEVIGVIPTTKDKRLKTRMPKMHLTQLKSLTLTRLSKRKKKLLRSQSQLRKR